jgi:hypothetical protein
MRTLAVLACVILSGCFSAYAQTSSAQPAPTPPAVHLQSPPPATSSPMDPRKEADIRQLLELTGAASLIRQMFARMEENMKPLMTNALPPGDYRETLITLFFEKFNSDVDPAAMVNLAVPIYGRAFSDREIRELIQFYQSPIGRKFASELPQMEVDLAQISYAWGQQLGRKAMEEVLTEHPELAKALKQAQAAAHQQPH